ncbi:hypothetical protein LCGC14_1241000 [marine sediment metagenome]|uniref:Uncharacterized protein n=1 Tax=marine sediment metagenome TaxID=412755 RepID=A0A0F9PA06_9ZZZZ|nr:hypothetical protein [Pricia sp.]
MNENETSSYERKMAKINNAVVTIVNPTKEDFTHSYDGIPFTLNAGETLPFPYPVGMHLAKHLAMRMIRKDAETAGKLKGTDDRKSVTLYTGKSLEPYIAKIVVNKEDKPLPSVKTESQVLKEKTEEMHKQFPKNTKTEKEPVTKKDVITELRSRDIKFNARLSREDLLKILIESEAKGGVGKGEESKE